MFKDVGEILKYYEPQPALKASRHYSWEFEIRQMKEEHRHHHGRHHHSPPPPDHVLAVSQTETKLYISPHRCSNLPGKCYGSFSGIRTLSSTSLKAMFFASDLLDFPPWVFLPQQILRIIEVIAGIFLESNFRNIVG